MTPGAPTLFVRLARTDDAGAEARIAQAATLLSPDEQRRVAKYLHEPSRRAFTLARGVLRVLLSELDPNTAPCDWRPLLGVRGKPYLGDGPSFNVSHTDGLVVVVASLGPIALGVDAEATDRASDLDKLAQRYFAATEVAAWGARAPEQRRDRFFDLWTLKESYMKATGAGFALGLSSFRFDLDTTPLGFAVDEGVDGAAERWRFGAWAWGRHRIALCCDADSTPRVEVRGCERLAGSTEVEWVRRHERGMAHAAPASAVTRTR